MTERAPIPDVSVRPLEEAERDVWRSFVGSSQQGTFYHDPAFFEVYRRKVEAPANLIFRIDGRIVAILPAGIVKNAESGRELRSPFSASFAGFLTPASLGLGETMAVVEATVRWARDNGVQRIVIQQPPGIYGDSVDDTIEFALRHSGFEQLGTELSYFITPSMPSSSVVARNVRKAEANGCRFEPIGLEDVWQFISAIKAERGQPFDIQQNDLLAIGAAFPGCVPAFGVFHGDALVAAFVGYLLNPRVLLGFHWAQRAEAQQLRPSDYLIHRAARWAFDAGARVVDLGTTTIGAEPVWGVTHFKEKFLPSGAMRRRFVKTIP